MRIFKEIGIRLIVISDLMQTSDVQQILHDSKVNSNWIDCDRVGNRLTIQYRGYDFISID
jgi:hypothetical protein